MAWAGWCRRPAAAVVLLAALLPVSCSGSPSVHISPTTHPDSTNSATGSPQPVGALNGKFKVTAIQFPTPASGYVIVGGFPGNSSTLYDWIERSTDSGRTWAPLPVGKGDAAPASGAHTAWVDASDAWSSVVSYASHSPVATLYFTTDAARTWRVEREPFWVTDIAVLDGSSWLVTTKSPRCSPSDCRAQIYTADRVGGPLAPLPAQPATTEEISALVRVTPNSALAVLRERDNYRLVATANAGRSWQNRALPCGPRPFSVQSAAAPDGTLYLTCTGPSESMCMSCGPVTIFRSTDIAATWTRSAARGTGYLCCIASFAPTSAQEVWLQQTRRDGSAALLRSTDEARTFTRVLTSGGSGPYLGPLTAHGDTAWVVAYKPTPQGTVFVVYHSVDGGKTWQTSPLPVPASLPRR